MEIKIRILEIRELEGRERAVGKRVIWIGKDKNKSRSWSKSKILNGTINERSVAPERDVNGWKAKIAVN